MKHNNTDLTELLDEHPISHQRAFELSQVNRTTWKRWLNGTRPPHTTLELIRLHARFEPPSVKNEWHGWAITQGKIFNPANRGFEPSDIEQIPSLYRDRHILQNIQKTATIQYHLFN